MTRFCEDGLAHHREPKTLEGLAQTVAIAADTSQLGNPSIKLQTGLRQNVRLSHCIVINIQTSHYIAVYSISSLSYSLKYYIILQCTILSFHTLLHYFILYCII